MNRKRIVLLLLLVTKLVMGGLLVAQDESPPVHDLTEGEVTEQRLIDALRPAEDPPAELLGTPRGIGVVARPVRPKCVSPDRSKSRGIAVQQRQRQAANIAAIKIYFAFNSAEILPNANPALDELGRALKTHPLSLCCFQIVGHTDNVGSDAYNDRLSQQRAQSVARYLADRYGIDKERLEAVGRGERRPMANNSSEAGRSKNRRVEIANLGYGQAEA